MSLKEMWAKDKAEAGCDILLEHIDDYYYAYVDDAKTVHSDFEFATIERITSQFICAVIHEVRINEVLDYYQSKGIKVKIMEDKTNG